MSFRARQVMAKIPMMAIPMVESVESQDENGRCLVNLFNPHEATLPSSEMFDLGNMIKAGVELKKMNTKLLGGDVLALADALNDIDEDDLQQPNNEVTHEQQQP